MVASASGEEPGPSSSEAPGSGEGWKPRRSWAGWVASGLGLSGLGDPRRRSTSSTLPRKLRTLAAAEAIGGRILPFLAASISQHSLAQHRRLPERDEREIRVGRWTSSFARRAEAEAHPEATNLASRRRAC